LVTGSRLTRWARSASAMSCAMASGPMLISDTDMTSRTRRSPRFANASSALDPSANMLSHEARWPSFSERPSRSPSLAIPIASPDALRMGTPPTSSESIRCATSRMVIVSSATTAGAFIKSVASSRREPLDCALVILVSRCLRSIYGLRAVQATQTQMTRPYHRRLAACGTPGASRPATFVMKRPPDIGAAALGRGSKVADARATVCQLGFPCLACGRSACHDG
jgi:hypothetical protein